MNTHSLQLADLTAPLVATLALVIGMGVVAPNASFAQNSQEKKRQDDKNLMRNLTIGLGAAAVYEGLKGKTTNAVILGAGAALTGGKYEADRKAQNRDDRYGYNTPRYDDRRDGGRPSFDGRPGNDGRYDDRDNRYDRRDGYDNNGRPGNDGRYNDDRYHDNGRFGNDGFQNDRYNYNNKDRFDNRRDPRSISYNAPRPRQDNGNHNGWNKKQPKGGCD